MHGKEVKPMSELVLQILSRIDDLSPQERAEVAYAYLRSLEPEEEGVEEAWQAELARRVAEIRNGRATGKPADQLFAELRGQKS
jgi:putative addiction module component (TIGR02574 family)